MCMAAFFFFAAIILGLELFDKNGPILQIFGGNMHLLFADILLFFSV